MKAFAKAMLLGLAVLGLLVSGVHAGLYDDQPLVNQIANFQEFEGTIGRSEDLWIVQFCTTTHQVCKDMAVAYGVISQLFKGLIHLAFVATDTPEGDEIARKYSIPTDRAPLMYWFLDDKTKPKGIDPSMDGAEALVGHMAETISQTLTERSKKLGMQSKFGPQKQQKKRGGTGSHTVTVTGPEEWDEKVLSNPLVTLVAFTAPWCGHCKMLQPEWDQAAEKLEGEGAQMVWVDATDKANEPIAMQFEVTGFPTILILPGGAPKNPSLARQYPGERKASAMVKYVLHEVDQSGVPKEIPELVSPDVLQHECKGSNHICVLAALPHILDSGASGRNKHRELLAKVSKTFRGGAFSFLWFEGGSQPTLESALELTAGFPAMVAYSMDRHAFAVFRGSFDEKKMTSFLHGVTSGRVKVVKLKKEKVPKIEVVEPWDGQDAEAPEEEFDLADIMGSSDDEEEEGGATNNNEGGAANKEEGGVTNNDEGAATHQEEEGATNNDEGGATHNDEL